MCEMGDAPGVVLLQSAPLLGALGGGGSDSPLPPPHGAPAAVPRKSVSLGEH
jgi:hypothetical protein